MTIKISNRDVVKRNDRRNSRNRDKLRKVISIRRGTLCSDCSEDSCKQLYVRVYLFLQTRSHERRSSSTSVGTPPRPRGIVRSNIRKAKVFTGWRTDTRLNGWTVNPDGPIKIPRYFIGGALGQLGSSRCNVNWERSGDARETFIERQSCRSSSANIYIYMCVCMYVCIYMYTYIYIYIYM